MKRFASIFLLLLLCACQSGQQPAHQQEEPGKDEKVAVSFFVGTYTEGESEGIYRYSLNETGGLERIGLAAQSENPSFLAITADRQYLVAVNEIDNENKGSLESFKISGDSLIQLSNSQSGGAHPCFITVNQAGFVLTANYTGGNVGLLRLDEQGQLTPLLAVDQHTGSGTTDRQEAPHAHSAWFAPDGKMVISVDLGTNELWFSELDAKNQQLTPLAPPTLSMAPGAGPRHLAFHPNGNWIYVVNELDGTVSTVIKSKSDGYFVGPSISTLPKAFTGSNTTADIHITPDGQFVYASNRGDDSIVMYSVNEDGSLNLLGHEDTRGEGPRNFALSPDEKYLLVANQYTNNLVSFERDPVTGRLSYVEEIEAPTPVCILFEKTSIEE